MKGYSPRLPLVLDSNSGYSLTKTVKQFVSQNLKMLILTSPGERVMDPLFGVGLYNFLFELNTQTTKEQLSSRIRRQVRKYMPFIDIRAINYGEVEGVEIDRNTLSVAIEYAIPSIGQDDLLIVEG